MKNLIIKFAKICFQNYQKKLRTQQACELDNSLLDEIRKYGTSNGNSSAKTKAPKDSDYNCFNQNLVYLALEPRVLDAFLNRFRNLKSNITSQGLFKKCAKLKFSAFFALIQYNHEDLLLDLLKNNGSVKLFLAKYPQILFSSNAFCSSLINYVCSFHTIADYLFNNFPSIKGYLRENSTKFFECLFHDTDYFSPSRLITHAKYIIRLFAKNKFLFTKHSINLLPEKFFKCNNNNASLFWKLSLTHHGNRHLLLLLNNCKDEMTKYIMENPHVLFRKNINQHTSIFHNLCSLREGFEIIKYLWLYQTKNNNDNILQDDSASNLASSSGFSFRNIINDFFKKYPDEFFVLEKTNYTSIFSALSANIISIPSYAFVAGKILNYLFTYNKALINIINKHPDILFKKAVSNNISPFWHMTRSDEGIKLINVINNYASKNILKYIQNNPHVFFEKDKTNQTSIFHNLCSRDTYIKVLLYFFNECNSIQKFIIKYPIELFVLNKENKQSIFNKLTNILKKHNFFKEAPQSIPQVNSATSPKKILKHLLENNNSVIQFISQNPGVLFTRDKQNNLSIFRNLSEPLHSHTLIPGVSKEITENDGFDILEELLYNNKSIEDYLNKNPHELLEKDKIQFKNSLMCLLQTEGGVKMLKYLFTNNINLLTYVKKNYMLITYDMNDLNSRNLLPRLQNIITDAISEIKAKQLNNLTKAQEMINDKKQNHMYEEEITKTLKDIKKISLESGGRGTVFNPEDHQKFALESYAMHNKLGKKKSHDQALFFAFQSSKSSKKPDEFTANFYNRVRQEYIDLNLEDTNFRSLDENYIDKPSSFENVKESIDTNITLTKENLTLHKKLHEIQKEKYFIDEEISELKKQNELLEKALTGKKRKRDTSGKEDNNSNTLQAISPEEESFEHTEPAFKKKKTTQ